MLPESITGMSISVSDQSFLKELADDIRRSDVAEMEANAILPYPHVHFFIGDVEFLIKLDKNG